MFQSGPMNMAFQNAQVSGTDINSDWYYCLVDGHIKLFVGASGFVNKNQSITLGQHLRPVTVVRFHKE